MRRFITAIFIAVLLVNTGSSLAAPSDGAQPAAEERREEIGEGFSTEIVSGPECDMPWVNDGRFTEAVVRYKTYVMLGGYRTVLKDPLPGEEYNVHLAADMLAGTVVRPGEVFSQNSAIGPYTESRGFREGPTYIGTMLTTTVGGGVCKIASTLYNVAVLSNVKITERHNHTMPVPYVPYGQDATVSYGNKDFKFTNTTGSDILIWAKGVDNVLYMAFYGSRHAPAVEWIHEVLETTKAPVMYRINGSLRENEKRLLMEGMDGAVVKSWVRITEGDDVQIKYMGLSRYQPMPHLVEKGPAGQSGPQQR